MHPGQHGILECGLAGQSASTLQGLVKALVEPVGVKPRVAEVARPMQQVDHEMVLRCEALLGPHALQVHPVGLEAHLSVRGLCSFRFEKVVQRLFGFV